MKDVNEKNVKKAVKILKTWLDTNEKAGIVYFPKYALEEALDLLGADEILPRKFKNNIMNKFTKVE